MICKTSRAAVSSGSTFWPQQRAARAATSSCIQDVDPQDIHQDILDDKQDIFRADVGLESIEPSGAEQIAGVRLPWREKEVAREHSREEGREGGGGIEKSPCASGLGCGGEMNGWRCRIIGAFGYRREAQMNRLVAWWSASEPG